LSRYRRERLLGAGGMATVELARDEELGRAVAVKTLHAGLAADDTFRERFLRESRLAARLSHPNIVHVFDAGADERGEPYLVMEYVEGESLAQLLERRHRLPPAEAVRLAAQAAAGIAHAHAAGLVHRDVKPHNLLVAADGTVKVADFGIARAAQDARLTETGTVLGTAAYLAPEQAAGEEATAASDVYGLGACLYEALAGRPPHEVRSLTDLAAKQQEPIRPVRELAPAVPPGVEQLVMRCLAREPELRPAAAELADALANPTEAATLPLPRPQRRRRLALWAALAAALVLVGGGLGLAAAFTGGSGSAKPTPTVAQVGPVPHGTTPAERARGIAAWLRRYSG
jgi:eukaryotic-like serine/threonine-protein kinase